MNFTPRARYRKVIEELGKELAAKEAFIAKLKDKMGDLLEEYEEKSGLLEQLEKKNGKLSNELRKTNTALAESQARALEYKKQNDSLKRKLYKPRDKNGRFAKCE